MQSVPITTEVVSTNPAHCEVNPIQLYVIKFVSDLWLVGVFLQELRFPHNAVLAHGHEGHMPEGHTNIGAPC